MGIYGRCWTKQIFLEVCWFVSNSQWHDTVGNSPIALDFGTRDKRHKSVRIIVYMYTTHRCGAWAGKSHFSLNFSTSESFAGGPSVAWRPATWHDVSLKWRSSSPTGQRNGWLRRFPLKLTARTMSTLEGAARYMWWAQRVQKNLMSVQNLFVKRLKGKKEHWKQFEIMIHSLSSAVGLRSSVSLLTGLFGAMGGIFSLDIDWPRDISTSPWMNPLAFVIFNFIMAVVFLAFQILHFSDYLIPNGVYYFMYLTNLALVMETIMVLCLFLSVLWGYTVLNQKGNAGQTPLFVKITVALWQASQPVSLMVVLLFWTIVNPIWDPEPIRLSSYWAHLINWAVLLFNLFICRIDFSFKSGIWSLIFLLSYLAWTVIHYVAQIGTRTPCDDYPQELCPLYDQFDWNQPQGAAIVTVAALVALLVVVALYVAFVRCRDACDQKPDGTHSSLADLEDGKAAAREWGGWKQIWKPRIVIDWTSFECLGWSLLKAHSAKLPKQSCQKRIHGKMWVGMSLRKCRGASRWESEVAR